MTSGRALAWVKNWRVAAVCPAPLWSVHADEPYRRGLGDLLDRPLVAVLATLRTDGTVLLSPVYHEWRDGGFNVWVEQQNVKARHLRRDPRATILVAESDPPLRAVEVRGQARFIDEGVSETALRIVSRYEGPKDAAADVEDLRGADVIVRVEPGDIRAWGLRRRALHRLIFGWCRVTK